MVPNNNPANYFLGTAEFSFCEGANTVAQAAALGFRDFGNLKAFSSTPGGDDKNHKGSYRGTVRTDRRKQVGLELGYKLTGDEFHGLSLALLWLGTNDTGSFFTQTALAAVPGGAITFSAGSPSSPLKWYDLFSSTGTRVRNLTAVTIATKTEGVDFEVDYRLGRIRFITAQTAAVTPTLSAAAIAAGDPLSMFRITPVTAGVKSGMGRLNVFEENPTTGGLVLAHEDFSCDLSVDGNPDLKNDDWSDYSVNVLITSLAGAVYYPQSRV